ncbi:MAG: hypothetical protein COX07_02280 [Bacteroidetes bacterium CG23_combo_of_CG06-09_8_20_14_all_32_9]|nr:MAG: hypothetical protein COX07_02280 [Bacteroidetes bacterium CG23_combo_of_CG06-09_8_20_14_all_32_9]
MDTKEYYNSQREKLIFPEYGRHIQNLIDYVITVNLREERNKMAKAIINIMANFTPSMRENAEFKIKLWNQLAQMSNYQLDIDYPCEITKREELLKKPNKIPYPANNIKLKHYGGIARAFIEKFTEMPDSESKTILIEMLANHMKKLYLVWNKEAVSDEQIFADINEMAGHIKLVKNHMRLNETRDILFRNQKPKTNKSYKRNNRKQR